MYPYAPSSPWSLEIPQTTYLLCTIILTNIINIFSSTEVAVEFDPVSYIVTEGEDVMFRIVKQTNSTRVVTVYFNAGNESANGITSMKLVQILIDYTTPN